MRSEVEPRNTPEEDKLSRMIRREQNRARQAELKTLLFVPDPGEQQGRNTLWQAKTLCGLNYAREYAAMPTKSTTEISVEMDSVVEIYSPCPVTSA